MLNPEKESLSLVENTNRQIISVLIRDPQLFGLRNLRELVRYQIYSSEEREIIIRSGGEIALMSQETLSDIKRLPKNARATALKNTASKMYNADEITIQIPNSLKRESNQGLILEELVVRKPQAQEMEMIVKNQSLWNDRLIRAEWYDAEKKVRVKVTIIPNKYRYYPQKLKEISKVIAGADKISLLRIAF